MKIIDFEAMFEEYAKRFLEKNGEKYTAEQLENIQPKLYEKFSNLPIKNIGGKTPREYYRGQGEKLIEILKQYIRENVPVDEFLTDVVADELAVSTLINCLNSAFDGEYLNIIIDIINRKGQSQAYDKYIELFFDKLTPPETVDKLADLFTYNADEIATRLICALPNDDNVDKKLLVAEIVSSCARRNEKVTEFIKNQLLDNPDRICQCLTFVVKYNDETMLDTLYEMLKDDTLGYVEFKELKLAIEALGGFSDLERDFSDDKNFRLLKGLDNDN